MQFSHLQKPLSILKGTFAKPFDGALVVFDEGSWTPRSLQRELPDTLDVSWDGDLRWMPQPMADIFLPFASRWFEEKQHEMHCETGEYGLSNVLLYARTPTGMAFVDTQTYFDSIVPELIEAFEQAHPDLHQAHDMLYIGDAHLADNLVLGRDSVKDQDAILSFLVQEGFLTDAALFHAIEHVAEHLDIEKTVVLTGTFGVPRSDIQAMLVDAGVQCAEKVTSANHWLWVGDKPGASKVEDAERLGAQISTPQELMAMYLEKTDQKPALGVRP